MEDEMNQKRYLIVLLFSGIILFSNAAGFSQEVHPGISEEMLLKRYNQKVLYPQYRLFGGMVFHQNEGNKVYKPNSKELHEILSQTPNGKRYIEKYSKNRRIAIPIALLSSTITLADLVWYVKDPNAPKEQPMLFWGNLVAGIVTSAVAGYFNTQSQNAIFLAVREYNQQQLLVKDSYSQNNVRPVSCFLGLSFRF